MARILIATSGTLGDVLPAAAVATVLAKSHEVHVLTHTEYHRHFIAPIRPLSLPYSPTSVLRSSAGQRMLEGGALGVRRIIGMTEIVRTYHPGVLIALRDTLADGAYRLVMTAGMPFGSERLALAAGAQAVRLYYQPHWPTDEFKSIYLSSRQWRSSRLNAPSHRIADRGARLLFGSIAEQSLGQVSTAGRTRYLLDDSFHLGIPSVFAIPDELASETIRSAPRAKAVGFVRPPRSAASQEFREGLRLLERLARVGPTIYVGFGSVDSPKTRLLTCRIIEAARLAGIAVAAQGLSTASEPFDTTVHRGLVRLPPGPHHELFPLVDHVIHHGGIGTSVAAFDAGKGLVLVPQWFDQFHWAWRFERMGVATAAYSVRSRQDARRVIEQRMATVPDQACIAALAASDGLTAAAGVVERCITGWTDD